MRRSSRGLRISAAIGATILFMSSAGTAHSAIPALDAVQVTRLSGAVFVTAPPGDYNRIFVVRQGGIINVLNLQTGVVKEFLNLTSGFNLRAGGEQGLLGLAFDPNYNTPNHPGNGKFYVYFTVNGGIWENGTTHVSQFQVDPNDPDKAVATEHLLMKAATPPATSTPLTFDHPQSNHNAGWIGFSPRAGDDYNLYVATGDGGNGYDQDPDPPPTPPGHIEPTGNAQNLTTLLGKMLRVHVDPSTATYTIPANNPFQNVSGARPEIWAYGLRNPFRDSFDRADGRMYIGDVGQSTREEVDVQEPANGGGGENYGWRLREGTIATPSSVGGDRPPGNVDPILDYDRSVGGTVIGGYVYRGRQIPGLTGTYVFGDYLAKKIFVLNYNGRAVSNFTDITSDLFPTSGGTSLNSLSGFGEDANGELYLTDVGNGNVFKIVPTIPNVMIDDVTGAGSSFTIHGFGVPFQMHTVRAVNNITKPFDSTTDIGTVTAGADGSFTFTDPNPSNLSTRFYRVVYP